MFVHGYKVVGDIKGEKSSSGSQDHNALKKEDSSHAGVMIDTTYKEIYYYDKNYRPYRYVNTRKDNTCVYEKKKE